MWQKIATEVAQNVPLIIFPPQRKHVGTATEYVISKKIHNYDLFNLMFVNIAENCTGSSATCPVNVFKNNSVVCNDKADICDIFKED